MRNASRLPLHLPFSLAGLLAALSLLIGHPANAQTAKVVSSCGSQSYTVGTFNYPTMDTTGDACGSGGGGGGSNAAAGPTGSAVPADAGYTGLNNGGSLIGWIGDSSGRGIVVGAGVAGTPAGGVASVQGVSGGTNLPVSQATASSLNAAVVGNVASGSADSGDGVKVAGVYNTTFPTVTNTQRVDWQTTQRGFGIVAIGDASSAFVADVSNSPGDSTSFSNTLQTINENYLYNGTNYDRMRAANSAAGTTGTGVQAAGAMGFDGTDYRRLLTDANGNLWTLPALTTTGGWTPKLLNALSSTAVAVKASGGQLGMLQCYNPNASQEYVQVYNIAQGSVTVGTSTPLESIAIAPTSTGGFVMAAPGQEFGTAITVAATTTATGGSAPGTALDCNASYN